MSVYSAFNWKWRQNICIIHAILVTFSTQLECLLTSLLNKYFTAPPVLMKHKKVPALQQVVCLLQSKLITLHVTFLAPWLELFRSDTLDLDRNRYNNNVSGFGIGF